MSSPLISVVLPVYNVEKYIKECMDSILNQTIQDFEILVIDDCSTDSTLDIIDSYSDDRIKIIKKKDNKGLIDSLNIGFKTAKGKYIARVDGDDINALDRFEKQLNILESKPEIKACGCWLQIINQPNKIIKHKETHKEISSELLTKCPMSLGATMLVRSAYLDYKFDESKKHIEDYDFWARTAWVCEMYNIQEVLYYYRVHDNQVSSLHYKVQEKGDIEIKLNLFKELKYNTEKYTDAFLIKVMFTKDYISVNEFRLFFKWIKTLIRNNYKHKVFNDRYLKVNLDKIIRSVVYFIFFVGSRYKIDKKWRLRALLFLPFKEKIYVFKKIIL
jgi:glycosyltransferase involved in cell wall biosynthesis